MDSITKKLVRDYIYYTETLEDVSDISSMAEKSFREELRKSDPEALEVLAVPPPKEGDAPRAKSNIEETVHFDDKEFKRIFRKLAVKCHPDKLDDSYSEREKAFFKKCYNDISIANDQYNWGLLLKVAMELDVDVEQLSPQQIENIKENIERVRAKINSYEESMAYKWYTLPDEENKKNYLHECAKIFKDSVSIIMKYKEGDQ